MYGETAQQTTRSPDAVPDLGRIKAAAERIGMAIGEVDSFLFRFRGPRGGDSLASSASTVPQPPDNYRNDIESLFEQVNRLEAIVAQLRDIG